MIILTGVKKHKSYIILFVLFLLFVILCVLFKQISYVSSLHTALESAKGSVKNLFDDFLVNGGMKSSFTIKYESFNDKCPESITISNNREDSYLNLSVRGKINLSAFSHKNKLGFYLPDNPEIRYTISSKNLSSTWNSSVYGKIVKIPDYIPDNLNYKKINSLLSSKKIIKASVVLGLGKDKININELTKNISVSNRDTYPMMLNGKKEMVSAIRVTIPKKDIINCISYNFSSSDGICKGYAVNYIINFKNYLESIDDKEINIDLILCKKKLIQARFSLDSKIIVFDIKENAINMYAKELNTQNLIIGVNINKPSPNILIANILTEKNYILKAKKNNNNIIAVELCDSNIKSPLYKITYRPEKTVPHANYTEKDVYNLSLYELMYITENIMKKSSL